MKQQHTHGLYETIDQVITDGVNRGLAFLTTEDESMGGRTVRVAGKDLLNFGTASYMSLERHPALVEGAMDALKRYGTQFAASRTYLQIGLYDELEDGLGQIFGKPVLTTGSTTLGHMAAIPVLVSDADAVILDHQVHSSIQTVVQILKARGVPISIIRHNRMDQLDAKVRRMRGQYRKIWYFADGIYSMFGDGAPCEELHALMCEHEQLMVYIDDAHGFSWSGKHGCGYVRARIPHHDQMVLAVSLNKSFSSAGGALVFPNEEMKRLVRTCGPTMIFCGPIQPPMLGAAIGALKLHLSDEFPAMQEDLAARIQYCNEGLASRGLCQMTTNDTPLYFIPTGLPRDVLEVTRRLMEDGCIVNMGGFPAVPMNNAGLRFHMHRGLAFEDIDTLLDLMAFHYKTVLSGNGVTPKNLARAFRMRELEGLDLSPPAASPAQSPAPTTSLELHRAETIADVPAEMWDACFVGRGPMDHATLGVLEPAFATAEPVEDRATMRYAWVTDADGATVAATFFSAARIKEDMFATAEISEKVEALRQAEGDDFLVATAVSLGAPITLGEHLFLDRENADWKQALALLVDALVELKREVGASRVLLREFTADEDPELKQAFLDLGFVEAGMPDMMWLRGLSWEDRDGYLASLKSRYRYDLRKEVLPHADAFEVTAGPPKDVDEAYALYMRVHARGRRMNVFALPKQVFAAMANSPTFDFLTFRLPGAEEPSAVMLSHRGGEQYSALLVGFDEELVISHAIYKVALFRTVERARELGAERVNMAYTAELVKKKIGARPQKTAAFVMLDDTFGAGVLQNL